MWKNRWTWSLILFVVNLGSLYLFAGRNTMKWINSLFVTGLILLMLSGIYFVIKGGFFNVFTQGLRNLKLTRTPRSEYGFEDPLDGSGEENKQLTKERFRQGAFVCLFVGLGNTLFSYALIGFM